MNDDRLDELLRALPPAPEAWVTAAFEIPAFAGDIQAGDDAVDDTDADDLHLEDDASTRLGSDDDLQGGLRDDWSAEPSVDDDPGDPFL